MPAKATKSAKSGSGPGRLFPVQEIGSLAKPAWLTRTTKTSKPSKEDVSEAKRWGSRLEVPGLTGLLSTLSSADPSAKRGEIRDFASVFGIRLQEAAGLDIVYDGEQKRVEMYEAAVRHIDGFEFLGHVRSFDNKYYRKAAVKSKVGLKTPFHDDEYEFVKKNTKKWVKVPITGPYTLADWSFNEHYLKKRRGQGSLRSSSLAAKRDFILDLAKDAVLPTIKSLEKLGADFIQIDEPAAATRPEEVGLFVEGINAAVEGVDAKVSVHICFSEYRSLFPTLLEMKHVSQFTWEFANRDDDKLGVKRDARPGYEALHLFSEYGDKREIGLGVTNVHVDRKESAELVRDRVLYAAELLGPERIYVNPDCGLRTRTWDVAFEKMRVCAEGAALARKGLE
ncbi:MAG TPA: hypothetical protein VI893_09520 [Thermoplasmata archaeon]|nr:hypothetical protein [Thermoplasmata archaeon]